MMKLFGKNKRAGVPHMKGRDLWSEESTLETHNAVRVRSDRHPVQQQGWWEVESEGKARSRTLGELVKTLNCAESRKERVDDMNPISWEQLARKETSKKASLRSRFQQKEKEEQEFRPVLITVQDSPVAMSPPRHQLNRAKSPIRALLSPLWQQDRKTSVKDPPTRITIGLDEPQPRNPYQQRPITARKRSGPKLCVREDQKQISWPRTDKPLAQADVSRASKWRNGIFNCACDDGDSTIESRSVMTGLSTDISDFTEYTTDDTDELTEEDPYNARNRQRKTSYRAPSRAIQAEQRDKSVLAGVAEDLGVVAGMLFLDGKACFTCVAETTKESVTSCHPMR
jgi:hypothetical protein